MSRSTGPADIGTPRRFPAWPAGLVLPALLALAPTPVLGLPPAIPCATSRALATIDAVGAAMYAWLLDVTAGLQLESAGGGASCPGAPPVDVTQVPAIPVGELRAILVPAYIDSIPELDPWGKRYDYRLNLANPLSAHFIALRSSGADGAFEGTTYEVSVTSGPAEDLVLYNTTRVRQPPRLDPVSRQLVTVERMQTLGDALLSWYIDVVSGATRAPGGGPTVDLSLITPVSASDLAALLTPLYAFCVPAEDGWGQPFDLRLNANLLSTPLMSIRSPGSDGLVEGDIYDLETFPADQLDRDLVWGDGATYRTPSPTRSQIFTADFESATLWGTWSCGPGF